MLTNLDLTDEQAIIKNTLRDFAGERIEPFAAKYDEQQTFPMETVQQLAKLGFLGFRLRVV